MNPAIRNVATIPNFTVAAGSYIIPNSDTVSTNFVLQGDTGGGSWVTIPRTEYEMFPKWGYIAQRITDEDDGADVDWLVFSAFRISAYSKSVSGTRTSYTNQTVTFAEETSAYSPIGQVGEINGEVLKNAFVNFLVAAGATVVIDEQGLLLIDLTGGAKVFGNASGLFATNASGDASFGLANKTVNATTWGGVSEVFDSGDFMFWDNDTSNVNIKGDQSTGAISFRVGMTGFLNLSAEGMSTVRAFARPHVTVDVTNGNVDLDDAGHATSGVLRTSAIRIDTSTGAFTIRGIATPAYSGAHLIIHNNSGNNMTIKNNGTPGAGYDKIITFDGTDPATTGDGICELRYNNSSTRWDLLYIRG